MAHSAQHTMQYFSLSLSLSSPLSLSLRALSFCALPCSSPRTRLWLPSAPSTGSMPMGKCASPFGWFNPFLPAPCLSASTSPSPPASSRLARLGRLPPVAPYLEGYR